MAYFNKILQNVTVSVILLKIDFEQCVKIAVVFGTRIGVKQLSNAVVNDKYRVLYVHIIRKRAIMLLKR